MNTNTPEYESTMRYKQSTRSAMRLELKMQYNVNRPYKHGKQY